ncbi:hypothetical protein QAD02_017531 [Eretmocerus hayati]|uniref:Uncharacterized protein n=1 Tax=Eretmocerus hayati TaxID=131215 RepID=A0ACC2PGN0_9HYME|nr:hypothetical protein QAD02_017531 [Eretmocerus hayati]
MESKSCSELICNPNLNLKIFALVVGIPTHLYLFWLSADSTQICFVVPIAIGAHLSYLTVLFGLVISIIFFTTTIVTEVSLLVAAMIDLLTAIMEFRSKDPYKMWARALGEMGPFDNIDSADYGKNYYFSDENNSFKT